MMVDQQWASRRTRGGQYWITASAVVNGERITHTWKLHQNYSQRHAGGVPAYWRMVLAHLHRHWGEIVWLAENTPLASRYAEAA